MEQISNKLLILEENQSIPEKIKTIPRSPKWFDTFSYILSPYQFCRENTAKYGAIFQTSVFGGKTIFVGEAEAIMMVFNGDNQYTEISLPPTTAEMFGEYSLFQRPDLHRERKSALTTGLAGKVLSNYLPKINQIISKGLNNWQNETEIYLYPEVEKISFDIFVSLLLGIELDDNQPDTFNDLPIDSKKELIKLYKSYFNGFYGLVKWNSPLTAYGRAVKARKSLLALMKAVIEKRRKQESKIDSGNDFLSMMLISQQEDSNSIFTDVFIQNQCLLELWASHFQVTGLISSLIYQMGKHREILNKLENEQTNIIEQKTIINQEQLKRFAFLEATIKETLRVIPPTSTANRRLTKSVLLNNILYPKDSTVIAEPRIAHFLPEYFPEPDKFIPERFLPPRNEGKMYHFIPFGGGVHACLGAQMAMMVTKTFASLFINRFDWQLIGHPSFVQFPINRIKDNYQIKLISK